MLDHFKIVYMRVKELKTIQMETSNWISNLDIRVNIKMAIEMERECIIIIMVESNWIILFSYKGDFKNGKFEGKGVEKYANGGR